MFTIFLINMGNLDLGQSNISLFRYCEHSKGYVMFNEHSDRGVTKIKSRNVNFLEEDFPSIGEVKGTLNYMSYEILSVALLSMVRVRLIQ